MIIHFFIKLNRNDKFNYLYKNYFKKRIKINYLKLKVKLIILFRKRVKINSNLSLLIIDSKICHRKTSI